VGFRIISAHPERLRTLIIQNANAYKEGLGAKCAARNIGPIRRRIPKCSMRSCPCQQPNSVTPSAPHTPSVIIRTPERTSMLTCRDPANARSKPICSTTTGQMSLRTGRGKRRCASTNRRLWLYGAGTIHPLSRLGPKRSIAIYRKPKYIFARRSPWTRRTMKLPVSFLRSWPNILSKRSVADQHRSRV
jgi:hypothetical protein